jgi:hypothetical protein
VVAGRLGCSTARYVIGYVLSHGVPTQGSPGSSPRGWTCGYGYGYYHGHRQQYARAGPECSSKRRVVQGTQAGYVPA